MADKTVTLKLQGGVTLRSLASAVTNFSNLISELSAEAKARGMQWDITGLEAGSAELTAQANLHDGFRDDQADFVVASYAKIGQELAEHQQLTQYRQRIRKPALALAEFATLGVVEEVVFETPEVDAIVRPEPRASSAAATFPAPIALPVPAFGAVTGRVRLFTTGAAYASRSTSRSPTVLCPAIWRGGARAS